MTYRARTLPGAARILRAHLYVAFLKPLEPFVAWLNDRLDG